MAITDTRPPAAADQAASAHGATEPGGLAGLLGTGDHKALGRLYIGFSLFFGVLALLGAAVARLDAVAEDVLGDDTAYQLFTGSELSLAFLVAIPFFVGLGLYVTPLQVGAASVAFPRAAALSLWTWLAGSITMLVAWAFDGGPGGTSQNMVDLSYLSLVVVVVALLLAAVSIATTVVAMRTDGMSLDLVPMFSWGMLVAAGAWLLTLPVLVANAVIAYLNSHNGQIAFTAVGDDPWLTLGWAILLPSVYVCAIPLLGAVGDIVPTLAGVRQTHRGVVMVGIGAVGALSLGAWAQPAQGGEVWAEPLFVIVSLAVVLGVFACLGPWTITLARGTTKLTSGLAIGIAAVAVLLVATLAGALFSIEPFQVQSVTVPGLGLPAGALGQSNLVFGAAITGALAAVWFWGPKITGRKLNEGLGKLVALLGLVGSIAWGAAPVIESFQNRISGIEDVVDALTVVSVGGALLLALAVLIGAVGLLGATKGEHAADDPWGTGQTLEWATASPPPRGNFGTLAPVRSPEPLLDAGGSNAEEAS